MPRKSNKETKAEFKEFKFEGENGNVFSGRLYPRSNSTDKCDIYPLSIVVNGLAIVGTKFMDTPKGSFVAFPSYKTRDGEYKAQCYFFNKEDMEDLSALGDYLVKLLEDI